MKKQMRKSGVSVRSWMITAPRITVHRRPNGKMVAVKYTGKTIWEK